MGLWQILTRVLMCLALLLPVPALADTIFAISTITVVAVYPACATVLAKAQTDLADAHAAILPREGVLVGSIDVKKVAPGAKAEVLFGPIKGLRLSRAMPLRAEGDRQIVATTNQVKEEAVMTAEYLKDEVVPGGPLEQVHYSEQQDLEIADAADPAPAEGDVEGRGGVFAWAFDVAPAETREVRLKHLIRWPGGFVLPQRKAQISRGKLPFHPNTLRDNAGVTAAAPKLLYFCDAMSRL